MCDALIGELNEVTSELDTDPEVGAIVVTGSERAFAAGADIKEMAPRSYMDTYRSNMFEPWANLTKVSKPVRYGLGGRACGTCVAWTPFCLIL